ncbi:hypothetical protein DJICPGNB_26980 [Escherichia coli]|nr:hypothetical protein DJICPGNB_26980 [Escherichia coli]
MSSLSVKTLRHGINDSSPLRHSGCGHRQNIFQQTSRHFIGDHRGLAGFNIFQCRVRIIAGPVAEQTDCLCITLFTTAPVHPKPGYRNNAKQRPVPYFLFAFDSARSKAVRAPDMVLSIFVCLQLDHRLLDRIQQQLGFTAPIIRCRSGSPLISGLSSVPPFDWSLIHR